MPTAYDELKAWVGYTPTDEANLRALEPIVTPEIPRIIDHFYERVLASETARAVLRNEEQVERLKVTLCRWLHEVLTGPHDEAYFDRRERIGRRHVEVGLDARYMFTAMAVVQADLMQCAFEHLPPETTPEVCASINRVLQLDLAIMTGTYVQSRERQQLQVLQDLLVRHLRLSVLLVADDGTIAAATPATQGLLDDKPVLGRPWREALPDELIEGAQLERNVHRARTTGREVTVLRVDTGGRDNPRSFRLHVVPLHNQHAAFLLQIEEITDVVSLESRLRRYESLAQLGSLSAAVAHELRNPLAGISGAIQVISRSLPADAPYLPIMHKVDDEIRRLNVLVTDLLAFARPSTARLADVDLAVQARSAIELIEGDWPEVHFTVHGEGAACADPDQLRQILLNLLTNAAQAVEGDGEVRVDVSEARLSVSDSGPGIPEARRDDVFEPFVTTKTRGTGLGLAISTRNAEAMQARLTLEEGPLIGATFVLWFEASSDPP